MTAIDSTGLQALENFADRVHESGRQLILCGAREQPEMRMHEAEFTNMWARRTSATVWRTPSTGLRSCTPRWRGTYQLGPPGAEEVPMNRGGSRHRRVPTPSTGNRTRMALQISEGKYGPHKIGRVELLKSPFIQLW
jgi:hypothetical protein